MYNQLMLPSEVLLVLSLIPFILFTLLLLVLKKSLLISSLTTFLTSFVILLFVWQLQSVTISASFVKAFFAAYDIGSIVFGALVFLAILKSAGIIDHIVFYLTRISPDIRVQTIILAWFLENFIEGSAGFGTPGAIVAPILVSLGIPPINAVIISLIGNSTAGVFGAAGTPTRIGLSQFAGPELTFQAASFAFVGILVPLFILISLSRALKNPKILTDIIPFALWSGFIFTFYSFIASFFGQEFPSIIGSLLGTIVLLYSLKIGFLSPKTIIKPSRVSSFTPTLTVIKSFLPYFISIGLLVIFKMFLGDSKLFNPGYVFLLSSVIVYFIYRPRLPILKTITSSFHQSLSPFLVIFLISAMVQLMLNSSNNPFSYPTPLNLISGFLSNQFLAFITPFIGAFGSFITGSITLSNIMFGQAVADSALSIGLSVIPTVALLLVGGSLGNMTALADILAAETVLGLKNKERHVVKGVILPCIISLTILGSIGFLLLR